MDQNSKYFKLFAECVLVKGYKRSAIYDLPRYSYKLIPNDLYNILKKYTRNTIDDVKKDINKDQHYIIDEYFKMLVDNEFIFFCDLDEIKLFPRIKPFWDYPGQISNSIIELPMNKETFLLIIACLEQLGCRHVQLRSFSELEIDYVKETLQIFEFRDFDYIEMITKWHENVRLNEITEILKSNPRLKRWYFHSAAQITVKNVDKLKMQKTILLSEIKRNHTDFHVNNKYYLNPNVELYFESLFFNNYYNRKVCFTKDGIIKNCLSLDKTYGKLVDNSTLKKVINTDEFQLLWHVNKDIILECKHCEFRYMCVDNTPLKYDRKSWSKTKPCFYKPYNPNF